MQGGALGIFEFELDKTQTLFHRKGAEDAKETMEISKLSQLKNIGKNVEKRLNEIGLYSRTDLNKLGSSKAYQRLSQKQPGKRLPVCYYLYSLEGALKNKHWDDFSESEKKKLRIKAGLSK